MAKARRKSTRSTAQASANGTDDPQTTNGVSSPDAASPIPPAAEDASVQPTTNAVEEKCPACKPGDETKPLDSEKESWIRCDACREWFHWRCVGGDEDLSVIDKWFCNPCREKDPSRVITHKPPARKSSRKKPVRDYANLHSGVDSSDPQKWLVMMQGKRILDNSFKHMHGSELTLEWLNSDPTALTEPIIIENAEGLGMEMPPAELKVSEIAETLGKDTPVEVIDVATQSNCSGWNLGKWATYFEQEPAARDKIRNVISLEVSGTELAEKILPPKIVREVDWVERFWPPAKKGKGHVYPKVQLYCLMGVAGAWTDWHVDFAGSSVYYHILRGQKVFYFIKPTPANLAAYERWSGTELQSTTWLGDLVDEVVKVELVAGNTMIIPSGWIHAVATPLDTLVFGGNFLHSYNVSIQLKVREIEIATGVPKKFRFPLFAKLCWYAGERYVRDLKAKEDFPERVLASIQALSDFLISEARTIERGSESAKREAKDQVPSDKVKDAPALARELRWRVRAASGYDSEDESNDRRTTSPPKSSGSPLAAEAVVNGTNLKRKRTAEGQATGPEIRFRNFQPKAWAGVSETSEESTSQKVKARLPAPIPDSESDEWKDPWMDWKDEVEDEKDGSEAEVSRRRYVSVKVRRTEKGVERQRIERVIENWTWSPTPTPIASASTSGDGVGVDVTMKDEDMAPS